MKNLKLVNEFQTLLVDITPELQSLGRLRSFSFKLFLAVCLNVVIAPTVMAATGGTFSRLNAYAIGLLLLVTVGLAIYLMMVMLQPQRF